MNPFQAIKNQSYSKCPKNVQKWVLRDVKQLLIFNPMTLLGGSKLMGPFGNDFSQLYLKTDHCDGVGVVGVGGPCST